MIVDEVMEQKVKFFCMEVRKYRGQQVARQKVMAFCKTDEACYLAVWRNLPVESNLRRFLYDEMKEMVQAPGVTLTKMAVFYIMSSPTEQSAIKPKLRELIVTYPVIWDLIKNEKGLEHVV